MRKAAVLASVETGISKKCTTVYTVHSMNKYFQRVSTCCCSTPNRVCDMLLAGCWGAKLQGQPLETFYVKCRSSILLWPCVICL